MNRRRMNHQAGASVRQKLHQHPLENGAGSRSATRHRRLVLQNLRLADGHRNLGTAARRWLDRHPKLAFLQQPAVFAPKPLRENHATEAVAAMSVRTVERERALNQHYWDLHRRLGTGESYRPGEFTEYMELRENRRRSCLPTG
ncbi:MAG: hypothetical protein AAB733_04690 [Patescibacteria group bacterium]|mgnify:FL=1